MTTRSQSPNPAWLLAILTFVFAAISVQYALKIHHSDNVRSAFLRWRPQIGELEDGVNIWEKHAHPNPPMMVILLEPFMHCTPALGSSLWFFVKAIMAIVSIIAIWSLLDSADYPFTVTGKALCVILAARPIEGDLVHGNVNLLILLLVVMALAAFCGRRDGLAGLLLGLAIACKLTPALFVPYLLYKRAWKALFASLGGTLLFGLLVPALFFGWSRNLEFTRSWHDHMIAPYAAGVVTSEHKNQSLPGLLHRMLTEEPSFSDYVGDARVVLETHNLASWSPRTVQGIIVVSMIAFAGGAIASCRSSVVERPQLCIAAEFGVVVLGMLLFCERTWKHHCVTLLVPFSVLAYCVSAAQFSRGLRWFSGTTLAVVALLMLSTSTGVLDHNHDAAERIGKLFQVYGAYTWAFLILLLGMIMILCKTISCPKESPR